MTNVPYDLAPLAVLITAPDPIIYGLRVISQETLLMIN